MNHKKSITAGEVMKYIGLYLILLSLVSCSGKTTVLLLPEDDGSVGMIEVRGEEGSQVIKTPNSYTVIDSSSAPPTPVQEMSTEEIEKRFSTVIKAQPPNPKTSVLYFKSDSTALEKRSKAIIQEMVSEIKERQPCEISVIGHTDRMGSRSYNIKLSFNRASTVRRILLDSYPEIGEIDIASHGENDPIVKTADGVSEPLNRRVEITVR